MIVFLSANFVFHLRFSCAVSRKLGFFLKMLVCVGAKGSPSTTLFCPLHILLWSILLLGFCPAMSLWEFSERP